MEGNSGASHSAMQRRLSTSAVVISRSQKSFAAGGIEMTSENGDSDAVAGQSPANSRKPSQPQRASSMGDFLDEELDEVLRTCSSKLREMGDIETLDFESMLDYDKRMSPKSSPARIKEAPSDVGSANGPAAVHPLPPRDTVKDFLAEDEHLAPFPSKAKAPPQRKTVAAVEPVHGRVRASSVEEKSVPSKEVNKSPTRKYQVNLADRLIHWGDKQRVQKLLDQQAKEEEELLQVSGKPRISKNSEALVKMPLQSYWKERHRLTLQRNEQLMAMNLEKEMEEVKPTPTINEDASKLTRTLDDILAWSEKRELKKRTLLRQKEERMQEQMSPPRMSKGSAQIIEKQIQQGQPLRLIDVADRLQILQEERERKRKQIQLETEEDFTFHPKLISKPSGEERPGDAAERLYNHAKERKLEERRRNFEALMLEETSKNWFSPEINPLSMELRRALPVEEWLSMRGEQYKINRKLRLERENLETRLSQVRVSERSMQILARRDKAVARGERETHRSNHHENYSDEEASDSNEGPKARNVTHNPEAAYVKSMQWKKIRDAKVQREMNLRAKMEQDGCSLHPWARRRQDEHFANGLSKSPTRRIFEKGLEMQRRKDAWIEHERQKLEEEEMASCTFRPDVSSERDESRLKMRSRRRRRCTGRHDGAGENAGKSEANDFTKMLEEKLDGLEQLEEVEGLKDLIRMYGKEFYLSMAEEEDDDSYDSSETYHLEHSDEEREHELPGARSGGSKATSESRHGTDEESLDDEALEPMRAIDARESSTGVQNAQIAHLLDSLQLGDIDIAGLLGTGTEDNTGTLFADLGDSVSVTGLAQASGKGEDGCSLLSSSIPAAHEEGLEDQAQGEEVDVEALLRELQGSLPEGWRAATTNDGYVYYYNSKTKMKQWEHPGEVVAESTEGQ